MRSLVTEILFSRPYTEYTFKLNDVHFRRLNGTKIYYFNSAVQMLFILRSNSLAFEEVAKGNFTN